MSLSEAITNVAAEAGYVVSSPIIGSSDPTTSQLLAIAQRVNQEMGDAYPWTKFYSSGLITLQAGVASYALPAAFSSYQYDSFWNQSTRWRVLGPMSEKEYADWIGYGLNTAVYQRFQIRGITSQTLTIVPTPTETGQTIVFEFISARYVRPRTWVAALPVTTGQYIFYDGKYYTAGSTGTTGVTPPTWTTTGSDGGVTWDYYSGAYTRFLADTDEPILSQRILEQGMLERFGQIHGLEGIIPKFTDQLNGEFSRDIPGKTLYAAAAAGPSLYAQSGRATFGSWWI